MPKKQKNLHKMKTSIRHQEPTSKDLLIGLAKIFGLFVVSVLTLAGVDLINQIMLWFF